jgi:predicted membrane-bound mannosyltransferase
MSIADPVILILGFTGGLLVAWRGSDRVQVYFGLWALGITAAYSLISYKVPWIALNMLIPLAILGGIAISEAFAYLRTVRSRAPLAVGAAALAACIGISAYQAIDLNFQNYDTEQGYPYVFVHTTRDALAMVDETERLAGAAAAAGATELGITFVTPEYWPLPWYYRANRLAGFFGDITPTEQAMIVARVDQEAEVLSATEDRYQRRGTYTLRPGVELVLWVRSDLAGL